MPRENSKDLKARDLTESDLLRLALAFCNIARNEPFGGTLASGDHVETSSYALASAIEARLAS